MRPDRTPRLNHTATRVSAASSRDARAPGEILPMPPSIHQPPLQSTLHAHELLAELTASIHPETSQYSHVLVAAGCRIPFDTEARVQRATSVPLFHFRTSRPHDTARFQMFTRILHRYRKHRIRICCDKHFCRCATLSHAESFAEPIHRELLWSTIRFSSSASDYDTDCDFVLSRVHPEDRTRPEHLTAHPQLRDFTSSTACDADARPSTSTSYSSPEQRIGNREFVALMTSPSNTMRQRRL